MNNLGPIIFITTVFLFSCFLNWYTFQGFKALFQGWDHTRGKLLVFAAYWLVMVGITLWILFTFFRISREGEISRDSQQVLNLFLTVTVTQITVILFLFAEDIVRVLASGWNYFWGEAQGTGGYLPDRRKFVSQLAFATAAIPFAGFVYGIVRGKYNFRVIRQTVYFKDLPDAFDGFTITQLSDIHAGSFTDRDAVQRGIDLAAKQQSDLFVFTGDLVNHKADEISPFAKGFAKIRAPFGQFSILGNHDYGDYVSWPSKEEKEQNFRRLKELHAEMGYRLLLDESVLLEKDGQRIRLLGVENWGVGFHAKGDLEKALLEADPAEFKILLSHDPSHWDEEVKNHPKQVHLTLSGHTHGMQFGIETPLIRWSPAQFRYPNWAGIAEHNGKYLYVNRGFGFHAFSGRVGIWPEITVLELRKA
ncbi:putative phosphoesterase [Lunatimonas lonarensis]|uniref:Putative phosphoesterase n=1 Tax=Lunatimonas lonarensis TaxID=1232681 RepID=R7ZPN5_9BACT|nr:metallophosphoesterase [Lunatimonas lonarensis]EON76047.1 putative phosphoesterase [Lunatimonas lonarensis]